MKNFFKKITVALMCIITLASCFALVGCENTCKGGHDYIMTSTTAACLQGGTEFYQCANCKKTKTEEISAYGHSYEKNKCVRCNYTVTDISQFPQSDRNEMGNKLEQEAPYISDSETVKAVQKLVLMQKNEINDYKKKVEQAEQALENARNQATVRRFNASTGQWEWQVDEKAVASAQSNLTQAKSDLTKAEVDWETYKLSYEVNCEGYAWNIAILAITNDSPTNFNINYRLAVLIGLQREALGKEDYTPDWYGDIVGTIKEISGIDIRTSAES